MRYVIHKHALRRCELCDAPTSGAAKCAWCTDHTRRSTPERAREIGAQRKAQRLQEHRDKLAQLGCLPKAWEQRG
jgi:hypothetical protein